MDSSICDYDFNCNIVVDGATAQRLIELVDGRGIVDLHEGIMTALRLAPGNDGPGSVGGFDHGLAA
jgi:hypothetical protein